MKEACISFINVNEEQEKLLKLGVYREIPWAVFANTLPREKGIYDPCRSYHLILNMLQVNIMKYIPTVQ